MTDAAAALPPEGDHAGAPLTLKSSQFRKARETSWLELEGLVARAEKRGIGTLGPVELERLPLLYRTLLSSLSVARSIALDRNLLVYLESLSTRAFLVVYGPRSLPLRGIVNYLTRGLPAAVRRARVHFLISLLATIIGVAAGFLLVMSDESWFASLVPSGLAGDRGPDSTADELRQEEIFAPFPGAVQAFAFMANFLFSHNTIIGIVTFSLGIAAGVPTILLLVYQGATLGAFVALHYNRGLLWDCLGWLSIHGVTELTAIMLCGAAGLVIAERVLFPGRMSRVESLASEGRLAAQIAVGAVLMLFVAAILEGGFRQLVQATPLRFAIGWTIGLLWLVYFTRAGRKA
jgi:uncharacterized membrane protein SpoIIM required for sporulation